MAGRLTGIVLKYLRRLKMELDTLSLVVTADMVEHFGVIQTPVCARTTLASRYHCYIKLY